MIKIFILLISLCCILAKFPDGKFKWFADWRRHNNTCFDGLSVWLGTHYSSYWQGVMIDQAHKQDQFVVFYSYIIAFLARSKVGAQDCDVGSKINLCNKGANYIRVNRSQIVEAYEENAYRIAAQFKHLDFKKDAIFLMEPDFYQYYVSKQQEGGPLSGEYMRGLFDQLAGIIKKHIPKALIAWDVSAWNGPDAMRKWWGYFESSKYIDLITKTGGRSYANVPNVGKGIDYKFMTNLTGKPYIVDCGYGVAGHSMANGCDTWKVNSDVDARAKDRVVAVGSNFCPTYRPNAN